MFSVPTEIVCSYCTVNLLIAGTITCMWHHLLFWVLLKICVLDSDLLLAGRSGFRTPVGARFFVLVHTCPKAHPASCTMGTHPLSSAEVVYGQSYTSTFLLCLHEMFKDDLYILYLKICVVVIYKFTVVMETHSILSIHDPRNLSDKLFITLRCPVNKEMTSQYTRNIFIHLTGQGADPSGRAV